MLTIEQLRAAAGGLNNLSDEQIAQAAYEANKHYYPDQNSFYREIGYNPGDNFVRGMRIAGNNTLAATAGMGALAADVVGADGIKDDLLDYGRRKAQRAMQLGRRSDDVDNFTESPGAFLASAAGQGVGYAAPSLLGGGAGALVARRLGVNARVGAAVGGYVANTSQEAGGIYNDQVEAGNPQPFKALGYGAAAGALDTIPEALGAGRFLKGGKGGLKGVAKGAVKQAGEEAVTETGQTALERMGADKSLTDEDAMHDYRNSAALGAVGGGMFGAATGVRRAPAPTVDDVPDLLNGVPPAPPVSPAATPVPTQTTTPGQDATLAEVPGVPLTEMAQPEIAEAPAAEAPADPNAAIREEIAARKQMIEQAKERGEQYGLKGNKQIELMLQLEALRDEGKITPEEFHENVVTTGVGGKFGTVQKFIDEKSGKIQPKQPKAKKATAPVPAAAPAAAPAVQEVPSATQPAAAPAPEAVASPVAAPAPAPVAGETGAAGVPATGTQPAQTPAVAAPEGKQVTEWKASEVRVTKKNAAKAAPAPKPAPAPAVAPEEQFDNYPDFVDWALKKVGATDEQADAFKMKGGSTEKGAEGIGEYAGMVSSTYNVGKKHGVSGQQVSNWVKDIGPKVKALELMHLRHRADDRPVVEADNAPELLTDEEASSKRGPVEADNAKAEFDAPELRGEDKEAAEKALAGSPDEQVSDLVGDNVALNDDGDVVETNSNRGETGVRVREGKGSGKDTRGGVSKEKESKGQYHHSLKLTPDEEKQAKAAWTSIYEERKAKAKTKEKVYSWDDIGPAQKKWFAMELASGRDFAEAFDDVSDQRNDGLRMIADKESSRYSAQTSALSTADHLTTAEDLLEVPYEVQRIAAAPIGVFKHEASRSGATIDRLDAPRERAIGAAAKTLLDSKYGAFFKSALKSVGAIFAVNPGAGQFGEMAAWPRFGYALSVTTTSRPVNRALAFTGDKNHAAGLASMLAHELTHIAEFVSDTDPQRTKHGFVVDPVLGVGTNEISAEALEGFHAMMDDASAEAQEALWRLDYALGGVYELATTQNWSEISGDPDETAYTASAELLPVLVQMHLEWPQVMAKYMPKAQAYVEALLTSNVEPARWRTEIRSVIRKVESNDRTNVQRPGAAAQAVSEQVQGASPLRTFRADGGSAPAAERSAQAGQANAGALAADQGGQADRGLTGSAARRNAGVRAAPGVVTPQKARQMTEESVASWTDPNRPDGADSEPINPKVKNLVEALNDLGVITTLSGDMYSDDLVYADLGHDLPYTAGENIKGLPEGWKVGTTAYLHTQALHDVAGVGDMWKDPDLAAEELERYGLSAGVRISRAGAQGVTRQEAEAVAAAVKQSLEAMSIRSRRSAGPRAVEQVDPSRRNILIAAAALAAPGVSKSETTLGKAQAISEKVLDQQMPDAAAKILRGNGSGITNLDGATAIRKALQVISSTGPVELRALARQIGALIPADGVMLTVDDRRLMNAHGAVTLSPAVHMQLFTAEGRRGLTYGTFLHESLHLAVAARYKALSSGVLRRNDAVLKMPTPQAAKALEQFRQLWDEFETAARKNPAPDEATKLSVSEAVNSPDEFFVRALTDARLQAYMAKLEYDGRSMLERFKDWVTGLFVKSGTRPSWLDAALLASNELVAGMGNDKADFARLAASNNLSSQRDALYERVEPPAGIEVAQDETPTLDNLPPAPDGTGRGLKNWAMALVQHKWRAMPNLLGALSTEQLADRFKDLPGKGGEAIKRFHAAMTRMSVRASTIMASSDSVKREWETLAKKHGTQIDQRFVDFLMRATQAQIWPDEAFDHESNKHIKDTLENRALHAQLKTTFDRLPTDYQAMFRTLQKDFSEKYQAKVKALRDGIIDGYVAPEGSSLGLTKDDLVRAAAMTKAERKAYLKTVGTTKLRIDTLRSMWTDLDDHADQFPTKLDGPYFPMMRFGDHIVSVKSATYLSAEKAFVTAKDALEALYAGDGYKPVAELEFQVHDAEGAVARAKTDQSKADRQAELDDLRLQLETAMKPVEAAREKLKKAQQALTKLKGDPSHYLVEMYEHIGEASAREKQLKTELQRRGIDPSNVKYQLKDKYLQGLDAVQPAFMKKLGERLSSTLPETEAAKVKNTMRELYMQMQPDRSALKAQIRRLGVAGFTKEALRAYAASSVRDAWHISRLENATPARDAMNELRFSDDMDSKLVGNELAKRVAQNMQMSDSKWLSAATNLTYMTYLGMSPAFALNQLTQPFVISLPVMAARHGKNAMGALGNGWKDAAQIVKTSYKAQQSYHFTADPEGAAAKGLISQDEAAMLRKMFDSGRIDITITHDLSNTAEGKDNWLGKAAALSAWPAQQAEVINRISTALAAYRLERKAGKSAEAATSYADKVISETHLNYASENRARWFHANSFGGWGKVMFQFRSYQQGMLFLIGKNMMEAVRGDKEAAKAVGYLMGAQLAAAGTTGLPFVAPLLWVGSKVMKALLDKDEERDLEEMLYQGAASVLGEKGARTLMKGIPAGLGVDLSGAIGLGNIMSPVPYVADKTNGRDQVAAYWIALTGGAPAGMVQNWAAALDAANKGDVAKAVGLATPMKGLSNAVKGAAQGMEGLVDSKGNEIVSPQDMDPADVVAKMLGFTTTDMARLQERRGAFFEAKQNIKDARTQILNDLVKARMSGKPDGDALEAQREFNQRNPEQRITVGNVLQAVQRRRQEAAAMKKTGGLPVGKHYKALASEFTEE